MSTSRTRSTTRSVCRSSYRRDYSVITRWAGCCRRATGWQFGRGDQPNAHEVRFTPLTTAEPRERASPSTTSGRPTNCSGRPGRVRVATPSVGRAGRAVGPRPRDRAGVDGQTRRSIDGPRSTRRQLHGHERLNVSGPRVVRMEVHRQAAIRSLHVGHRGSGREAQPSVRMAMTPPLPIVAMSLLRCRPDDWVSRR